MKTIYILVGKKGSGKTHIGKLIDKHLQIPFLEVEKIFLAVIRNRDIYDRHYIAEGFAQVEEKCRKLLLQNDQICFEATGLSRAFQKMTERLEKDFQLKLIHVNTNADICLQRVEQREQARQIPLTREQIIDINSKVERQIIRYDFSINNDDASEADLLAACEQFPGNAGRKIG